MKELIILSVMAVGIFGASLVFNVRKAETMKNVRISLASGNCSAEEFFCTKHSNSFLCEVK
jgi:hypothetical protein